MIVSTMTLPASTVPVSRAPVSRAPASALAPVASTSKPEPIAVSISVALRRSEGDRATLRQPVGLSS